MNSAKSVDILFRAMEVETPIVLTIIVGLVEISAIYRSVRARVPRNGHTS